MLKIRKKHTQNLSLRLLVNSSTLLFMFMKAIDSFSMYHFDILCFQFEQLILELYLLNCCLIGYGFQYNSIQLILSVGLVFWLSAVELFMIRFSFLLQSFHTRRPHQIQCYLDPVPFVGSTSSSFPSCIGLRISLGAEALLWLALTAAIQPWLHNLSQWLWYIMYQSAGVNFSLVYMVLSGIWMVQCKVVDANLTRLGNAFDCFDILKVNPHWFMWSFTNLKYISHWLIWFNLKFKWFKVKFEWFIKFE